MERAFGDYKKKVEEIIKGTIEAMECRPIYFVGTGISKRYIEAPNWRELLLAISSIIGMDAEEFNYLVQKNERDDIRIGTELEDLVFEWAWKGGKNSFPKEYFESEYDKSIFIKHLASAVIKKNGVGAEKLDKIMQIDEVSKLSSSHPHAIITTNYDGLLEAIFPEYEPVVGQKIIRRDMNIVGEIFKIHGSVDEPKSIVLTEKDYRDYRTKKKYVSAKLLTYLAEHPVFIFGYGLNDPNVSGIIEDIGEIVCQKNGLIENIFYVEWREDADSLQSYREEYVVGNAESQLRVRAIVTDEYGWIFDAISANTPLRWVDPRVLRTITSRFHKIIRKDIPQSVVEIDYGHLSGIADSDDQLPKFFGFGHVDSPSASHPYSLTDVGRRLGYRGWHKAQDLILELKDKSGFDIKSSDNIYHYAVPSGSGMFRRYSDDAIDILKKVRDGLGYTLDRG